MTLPYLIILWRLAGPTYKRGLAMAVTMGAVGSVISTLILTLFLVTFGGPVGAIYSSRVACFMVSQLALVTSAAVTYYSMGREVGDTRTLMLGFVTTAIYGVIFLFGMGLANLLARPFSVADQSSAVGSLRMLNTSEVTYESTYPEGYSPTLAALGGLGNAPPTASASSLIDDVLASGKKAGYTFTYVPGPRDANGRIPTYSISARPSLDCRGTANSYFTDQTGVVRMSNVDHPATVNDPPLAG